MTVKASDSNRSIKDADYSKKVAQQLEQYATVDLLHTLPAICEYWLDKFIIPRRTEVFYNGKFRSGNFYANLFADLLGDSSPQVNREVLSLGSGDCKHEVAIVGELKARGIDNFKFECLELSDSLLKMGRKAAEEQGLAEHMIFSQVDVNIWDAEREYTGVMAHQALHHFVELERIFSNVRQCIGGKGTFITCDAIGKNGHQLWPEALALTESLWRSLPVQKKFHYQFKKTCETFPNHDCSTQGFEGIRSQDILPLLTQNFHFDSFFGYGGLIDPFVGRSFGPNYSPAIDEDRAFIDAIQLMNDSLCDVGYLNATRMMAVMRNPTHQSETRFFRHWSPEFCQRL